jgi:hypothetical protein
MIKKLLIGLSVVAFALLPIGCASLGDIYRNPSAVTAQVYGLTLSGIAGAEDPAEAKAVVLRIARGLDELTTGLPPSELSALVLKLAGNSPYAVIATTAFMGAYAVFYEKFSARNPDLVAFLRAVSSGLKQAAAR